MYFSFDKTQKDIKEASSLINNWINDACLRTLQPRPCARPTSSVVETDAASVCRGGVTARMTALTTAMKRAVRKLVRLLQFLFFKEAKYNASFNCSYDNSSHHLPPHLFPFFSSSVWNTRLLLNNRLVCLTVFGLVKLTHRQSTEVLRY